MGARRSNISVTIATQRSGTKLLGNCFNKGTEILSFGELFHDQSTSPLSFKRFVCGYKNFSEMYSVGRIFDVLDAYFNELRGLYKSVHFDFMYSNLYYISPLWWDNPSKLPILDYFMSRQFAIIHLLRRIPDTYVSLVNAQITERYHETADGATSVPAEFPEFSPEYADIVAKYELYAANVGRFRDAVSQYLSSYPYACAVNFEEMVDKKGFLTGVAKNSISSALQTISNVSHVQIDPVDLVVSQKSQLSKRLLDAIR